MGFVLSVLYFVTYYLTPVVVFGPIAAVHIEVILAALVFVVSLPALPRSYLLKTPQSLALIGLAIATFLSVLIGEHWLGGGLQAFLDFIPCAFAYYLVCLHFNSKRRLKILVLMMLFVCLFVIARGSIELRHSDPDSASQSPGSGYGSYLLAMKSDAGEWFYRLRGQGQINDPNDFGQVIVSVIPLVFIFWRSKRTMLNIVLVILPVSVLLYGAYLTHSRGALVALMAAAVVAARRRIGTLPALLVAGVLFAAAIALHFTGGREISAESGAGRMALWGEGLELMKSHPLFGVGYGNMKDYSDHTAHNSIAVCAAELGLTGLFFWSMFLFPTVRNALALASPSKVSEGEPVEPAEEFVQLPARKIEVIDKAEVNRLGRLLIISLTGFLVTGWFLSRAYVMTLFLLGGITEVVFEMAFRQGMIAPRLPYTRVMPYAAVLAISLVLLMYIMLRVTNLTH
jgi:O-antigen ligase